MTTEDPYVFLVRLEPRNGYLNMGACFALVGELQQRGIDCRVDPTPGAPLEGVTVYNLMVRPDQFSATREILKEIDPKLLGEG
ncbi:MAG: hypothetical protein CL677_06510 [Bdellovibrionaceae bacterium]|nr:hypothetical protein [Pseudobdellovibrionaceae bacterium]